MAGRKNDDQRNADTARSQDGADADSPYRASGSGASYSPGSNWARERDRDRTSDAAAPGMEGAPSGAGDGGFGPEGDFSGRGGQRAADVLGQVNGDDSRLVDEAQERGPRKADRRFTGGEGVDEPDGTD